MKSPIEGAKEDICLHLTLNVILGELDEDVAQLWQEAIDVLNEDDMRQLLSETHCLKSHEVASITMRFLMNKYYPFCEFVMYNTDDEFKQRMGISDLGLNDFMEGR